MTKKGGEILDWLRIEVTKFKKCCSEENIEILIPDVVDTHIINDNSKLSTTNNITGMSSMTNAQTNCDENSTVFKSNTHPRSSWAQDAIYINSVGDDELI